jgi:hypothetical protein
MQRLLITLGAAFLVVGLLWPLISSSGLGRLPGDISIQRPGVRGSPWAALLFALANLWFIRAQPPDPAPYAGGGWLTGRAMAGVAWIWLSTQACRVAGGQARRGARRYGCASQGTGTAVQNISLSALLR